MAYRLSPTGVTIDGNTQLVINKNPGVADMTGYILRTDASGVVSWASPASLGIGGGGGAPGTSGTSGSSGTSGISGVEGSSGTSGQSGTSGTSGRSGTSGTSGAIGTSGTSGIPTGGSVNQILYKSGTPNYSASWTDQGSGSLPYFINENKSIYVDPLYGSDTAYAGRNKYDRTKPWKRYAIAKLQTTAEDCIVILPGTHSMQVGDMRAQDGTGTFMAYAMPGSVIYPTGPTVLFGGVAYNAGRPDTSYTTFRFYGHAIFYADYGFIETMDHPNRANNGATYTFNLEFDSVVTNRLFNNRTLTAFNDPIATYNTRIRCNSMSSGNGMAFTSWNSTDQSSAATYSVYIKANHRISCSNDYVFALAGYGGDTGIIQAPYRGEILIDCPIIENTRSADLGGPGAILTTSITATASATASFKMDINSKLIRITGTYAESAFGGTWPTTDIPAITFNGGDNITITGEILAGSSSVVLCTSGGATSPHYGNLTLKGKIYSDLHIVRHTLNAWGNVIIRDSFVQTKGISTSMFIRDSLWDVAKGGLPGKTMLIGCVLHHRNVQDYPISNTAAILYDALSSSVGSNNNFQVCNCVSRIEGLIEGAPLGTFMRTTQVSKNVSIQNTISRQNLGTGISNTLPAGEFLIDFGLIIPRPDIINAYI